MHGGLRTRVSLGHILPTLAILVPLILVASSTSAEPAVRLVKDIVPGERGSRVSAITMVGDLAYFRADDGVHGYELWESDGTEAGTAMVRDILEGPDSSEPTRLTAVGGTLFFVAQHGSHGPQLWRSDGTEAGTIMVKDIPSPSGSRPGSLTDVGGTLYFTADDGTHGEELWKSDGTEAGTVLVKDILQGPVGSGAEMLTDVGGTLYFTADDGTHGEELWKSDGTEAGTVMVKDIEPGEYGPYFFSLAGARGVLYFSVFEPRGLWKSDGTEAGTVMVKEFPILGDFSWPHELTDVDGVLYFEATDGEHGRELWKSDGTEAGTIMVKDIVPGGHGSRGSDPDYLTAAGNTLLFWISDPTRGTQLWKSDGTEAGTVLVKDITPSLTTGGDRYYDARLTEVAGAVYFGADDGSHGLEPWRSDGTRAGTVMVSDLYRGMEGSSPHWIRGVEGTVFFAAKTLSTGRELWSFSSS